MFKKLIFSIFAVVAVLVVANTMTSCKSEQRGDVIYSINMGDFFDNMDILRNAIEKDFEKEGFTLLSSHNYLLNGEVNACNKKAEAIFKKCCQAVDQDRTKLSLPLALKGVTISMVYCYGSSEEHQLCTYTFVCEDK